jgi:hypothetical protein
MDSYAPQNVEDKPPMKRGDTTRRRALRSNDLRRAVFKRRRGCDIRSPALTPRGGARLEIAPRAAARA